MYATLHWFQSWRPTSVWCLHVPVVQHGSDGSVQFGVDDRLEPFPGGHVHIDQHAVLEPTELCAFWPAYDARDGQKFALYGVADVIVPPEGVMVLLCSHYLHQVQNYDKTNQDSKPMTNHMSWLITNKSWLIRNRTLTNQVMTHCFYENQVMTNHLQVMTH